MESRLIDKGVALALCMALALPGGIWAAAVVALLVAVSLSAAFELSSVPPAVRTALPLGYCGLVLALVVAGAFSGALEPAEAGFAQPTNAAAITTMVTAAPAPPAAPALLPAAVPVFAAFLPLIAADLMRVRPVALRPLWVLPLLAALAVCGAVPLLLLTGLFSCLACALVWRSNRTQRALAHLYERHDNLAAASYNLEQRNSDLRERLNLELRLATLDERGRIAREIHDNVGHLLTRSVLQAEALAVVHGGNEQLTAGLDELATTLHEAFESVRASVHELHDNSADLKAQLTALTADNNSATDEPRITLDYRAAQVPPSVAYAFLTIVREALSNTKRHSNATAVRATVVEFPALFQLTVHDNGSRQGSANGQKSKGGMGLTSMEERIRSLGGQFCAGYEQGFKVFASVPKGSL